MVLKYVIKTSVTSPTNNVKPFIPKSAIGWGGNNKVYGAALLRLRERDFERVEHLKGISPQWFLKYKDFEPYYTQGVPTRNTKLQPIASSSLK